MRRVTLAIFLLTVAACSGRERAPATPTAAPAAVAPAATVTEEAPGVAPPPTWTPAVAPTGSPTAPPASFTPRPSRTPAVFPSDTPVPSPTSPATATPVDAATPTETATPAAAPTATSSPAPAAGTNLLPNASFEEGWYHINGVPELQVPNRWVLEWESGGNPLDPDPWNDWVRPEIRVLSADFLPPTEHDVFIWDGRQTVKVFKGQGAVSFRLLTDVYLEPGTYQFEIYFFPDLVVDYTGDGEKVWAPDPLSGEVRFVLGAQTTPWVLPTFGQKNRLAHAFSVETGQVMRLGAAMRGRWAIENNGWFMDDWSLRRLGP